MSETNSAEKTFVMLKPDAVDRGLVGRILSRFEDAGLDINQMYFGSVEEDLVDKHYPDSEEWLKGMGKKTLKTYDEYDISSKEELGTDNPHEIGIQVKEWLIDYITEGPIVALILEGQKAVSITRKLVGDTLPLYADPGTIRGDFETDSPIAANRAKRAVRNLVHASGDTDEAEREVRLWFGK